MTMRDVALHPMVAKIASDFALDNGALRMSRAAFDAHAKTLAQVKDAEKKPVLASLVALAARFLREGKGSADAAAAQLTELAAVVIGDPQKARALFAKV
jgi:hypothetical protein